MISGGEACDDGNATSGDGCDNNCTATACGNGVATIVISRWEGELDAEALHKTMAHPIAVGEEMERVRA